MSLEQINEVSEKIKSMDIRGAGKIARSAALALKDFASDVKAPDRKTFREDLRNAGDKLISARPSAVSLPNSVNYIFFRVLESREQDVEILRDLTKKVADDFIDNSLRAVERIGCLGSRRINEGDTILTHCNSSAAIAVLKKAHEEGKEFEVIATESRPRYQGHITVKELVKAGIPTTMIVDSAVRAVIKDVDKVIVGADSIAANGAVINKIGTSQIALCANEARVAFFVSAESYKFHPETYLGQIVEIEERDHSEVADANDFMGVKFRNPAFDVTPSEYIDLIITEKGVIPPQAAIMVIKEEFGWALNEKWSR